jgi:hypothetical protein
MAKSSLPELKNLRFFSTHGNRSLLKERERFYKGENHEERHQTLSVNF